jgi:proline iminopeptidase
VHRTLPASRLQWVEGCGHNPFESANAAALTATIQHFAAHGNFAEWGAALTQAPAL